MATLGHDVLGYRTGLPSGSKGPITAARHRRNAMVYAALCVLAFTPLWLGATPAWQAAGLGLFLPGAGFLAVGGWAVLLLPVTLAVFWLSVVAWFWAGMVVAPLAVWLGSAALAGALVGPAIWAPAAWLAPASAALLFGVFQYRGYQRRAADSVRYAARQGFFEASRAEVNERVLATPEFGTRELTTEQLMSLRYVLERALQPVGEFRGYTIIDQFQPAALRYQINHLGFALGLAQCHYTPNFHGYLAQAQRNLIETYLAPRVWDYWVLESMWGHFNFSNFDPAAKDNIMLTGWYGMQVNQYMLNSGDRRYDQPASLTFRLNERTAFPHDAHTLAGSVASNFKRSDFCLYPCEPNWVYPVCNMYGMSSLAAHDAVFGTHYVRDLLPGWLEKLETEFVDGKGSIVGLRSYWTGLEMPFYNGEAGFAFFANVFSTPLARRLWAIGRKELAFCMAKNSAGEPRITIPREALSFMDTIDPGNYRPGSMFAYAAVAICGREFGDDDLAEAALRSMDEDCGRRVENGVLSYDRASNLANTWAVEGRLMGNGDFRASFVAGPSQAALQGPLLDAASYPDVLVAKAVSDGQDLALVLYPGRDAGRQTLGLARLVPGAAYRVAGRATPQRFNADSDGRATLEVEIDGRTELRVLPQS